MNSSCFKEKKCINAGSSKVKRDIKPINIGGYIHDNVFLEACRVLKLPLSHVRGTGEAGRVEVHGHYW